MPIRRRRSRRDAAWAFLQRRPAFAYGLCLLGVGVAAAIVSVRIGLSHWPALGDQAAMELRIRAVGGRHTPLVGPYSRYGWDHPGPLLFYALTPFYRLLGGRSIGLLLGALVLNILSLVCIVVFVHRRSSRSVAVLAIAVITLLANALGPTRLADPWNPNIVVLPVFAVVVLAWSVASGDWIALPLAIAFASFAVQSHVSVALVVAVPIVVAIALVAARRAAPPRPVLIGSGGLAALLWLPPLIDQLRAHGGNAGDVIRYFAARHPVTGLSGGAKLILPAFGMTPPWITGREPLDIFSGALIGRWELPVSLIVLLAAAAFLVRRPVVGGAGIVIVVAAVVVASFVSTAHVVLPPYGYIFRWVWAVGAAVWFAIGYVAIGSAGPRVRRGIVVGCVVIAVAAGAHLAAASVHSSFPSAVETREYDWIHAKLLSLMETEPQPILLRSAGLREAIIETGVLAQATRLGIDARYAAKDEFKVGSSYVIDPAKARTVLLIAMDRDIDQYAHDPRYRVVLAFDSARPGDRAELQMIQTKAARLSLDPPALDTYLRTTAQERNRLAQLTAIDVFEGTTPSS